MRRLTTGYAVAMALSATALLTACTTPPVTDPPSSTSATSGQVSSTTGATPPPSSTTAGSQTTTGSVQQIPEAARANTGDGAVAFTKFFAGESNSAYNQLNPDLVSEWSAPSCQSCKAMISSINSWKTANQKYVGEFIKPTNVILSAFPGDDTAKVLVSTHTDGAKLLDAKGSTITAFPAESGNLSFSLAYDHSWTIVSIKGA